ASYTPKVKEILRAQGCYFEQQGRGDHEIWYSPITQRRFPVDQKILFRHTANAVPKQAGIAKPDKLLDIPRKARWSSARPADESTACPWRACDTPWEPPQTDAAGAAALPQQLGDFSIADRTPVASVEQFHGLPRLRLVLSNLFRRELIGAIEAPGSTASRKA